MVTKPRPLMMRSMASSLSPASLGSASPTMTVVVRIAEGDVVLAELLQRLVGIGGLVVGIGIDQRRLAIEHHLAQDRRHRLALGEPLPA